MSPRSGVERSQVIDGIDTHWWEYASDPAATTIVFVPGFRGDHHGLQLIADALADYRIIIPDIPVFGSTGSWPNGVGSIVDYARWLREFLTATDTTNAVVLGHSFGSIVVSHALRGSRSAPIILVNPISQRALTGPKRVAVAAASLWYAIGGSLPEPLSRAWLGNPLFVRAMSGMLVKSRNSALRRWIHDQHARYFSVYSDRDSLLGAYAVSTSATVGDVAADVSAPVLLIAADRDDITPLSAQREIKKSFPNAELVVLDNVGHLVHYERPIESARAIREFLKRHGL